MEVPRALVYNNKSHDDASPETAQRLRVMSFNVLASCYVESHFSYCPPEFLDWDFRFPLILKHILDAAPDLVCLQEVERKAYVNDFVPALSQAGYSSAFHVDNTKPAGSAVFYLTHRFLVLATRRFSISDLSQDATISGRLKGSAPRAPRVTVDSVKDAVVVDGRGVEWTRHEIAAHNRLWSWIESMPQGGVALSLMDVHYNRPLVISSYHVYWNPRYPEAKVLQCALVAELLDHMRRATSPDCAVIFAGDFNSLPAIHRTTDNDLVGPDGPLVTGVVRLLESGELEQSHPHHPYSRLRAAPGHGAGSGLHAHTVPHIALPLRFFSAYKAVMDAEPAWTNWHGHDFKETLDYIWLSSHERADSTGEGGAAQALVPLPFIVRCVAVLDVPSDADVMMCEGAAGGGCPNSGIPSDHIPLLCDVEIFRT